jgi:hypothetical protein
MNVHMKQSSNKYQGKIIYVLVDLDEQQMNIKLCLLTFLVTRLSQLKVAYGGQKNFL